MFEYPLNVAAVVSGLGCREPGVCRKAFTTKLPDAVNCSLAFGRFHGFVRNQQFNALPLVFQAILFIPKAQWIFTCHIIVLLYTSSCSRVEDMYGRFGNLEAESHDVMSHRKPDGLPTYKPTTSRSSEGPKFTFLYDIKNVPCAGFLYSGWQKTRAIPQCGSRGSSACIVTVQGTVV